MEFSEIVAITGMQGLYKVVAKREDGMIVSELGEDKSKFVSARIHMFTPLENITIYTNDDSVTLKKVFKSMKEKINEASLPDAGESGDGLKKYFEGILPDYDKDKVYVSDIKKVVKWYKAIDEKALMTDEILLESETEEEAAKEEPAKAESSSEAESTTPSEKKESE